MKLLLLFLFVFKALDFDYADYLSKIDEIKIEKIDPKFLLPDLEMGAQDFVLETKRISIPGFEDAFNPSVIQWKGKILMSFRTYHPEFRTTNEIALIVLNEKFEPVSRPQFVQFAAPDPYCLQKRQDPRLIQVGERLCLVYNNAIHGEVRRMLFGEMEFEGDIPIIQKVEFLSNFEGALDIRSEKNWVPFDHDGKLHFASHIQPHKILTPLMGLSSCETLSSTDFLNPWNWGILRGGTPAIRMGDQYLAFFHSVKNIATEHSYGMLIPHYFMGAYTFSASPPFAVTRISPEPIVGKNFYKGNAYKTWRPLRVVFPGGFIANEEFIWIVYGRQDHEIWVAKLNKQMLLNSLIAVQ